MRYLALAPMLAGMALLFGSVAATGQEDVPPAAEPVYYLSLGDSMSVGVQPDAEGRTVETEEGYSEQLYALLREQTPTLEMVKLGCDGEKLSTMMSGGGRCAYEQGSQLAEAVAFLEAHPTSVAYVSIAIGANDAIACTRGGVLDLACAAETFERAPRDLATIVSALRLAAGPQARIAGMSLYNPWLSNWLQGQQAQQAVRDITGLTGLFNSALADSYLNNGAVVADVAAAFDTADFETLVAMADGNVVPLNVARICAWTYRCAPPPVGPDIHPNTEGYAVIAHVFAAALLDTPPVVTPPQRWVAGR